MEHMHVIEAGSGDEEDIRQDVAEAEQEPNIFIQQDSANEPVIEPVIEQLKPVKKKRPLSEKQKAHLIKARAKAQTKAKEKRELKNAVEAKVKAEIEKAEPTPPPPAAPHKLTEDFKERMNIYEPSEEEIILATRKSEEAAFMDFHKKMKQYNAFEKYLKAETEAQEQKARPPTPTAPPPPSKPLVNINTVLKPVSTNPYEGMFDWS